MPDYKNNSGTSETESLGYTFSGNKVYDPVTGKDKTISATIHTHISLYKGKTWGDDEPSPSDIYKFTKETPNVPFVTIGDKQIIGYYGSWKPGTDNKYHSRDIKYAQFMSVPQSKLFSGLKSMIKQNISKYGKF